MSGRGLSGLSRRKSISKAARNRKNAEMARALRSRGRAVQSGVRRE